MKKMKWIALALVLMLGLIGGAYALWDDELEIGGTLNTGTFEVEFTNQHRNVKIEGGTAHPNLYQGIVTATHGIAGDQKSIWIEMNDLFPAKYSNTKVAWSFRIENVGTTPAVLKHAYVEKLEATDPAVWDHLKAKIISSYQSGKPRPGDSAEVLVEELGTALEALMNGQVLDPGDQLRFDESIHFWMDLGAPNEMQGQSAKFRLVMEWEQIQ